MDNNNNKLMILEITNPEQKTYFICYNADRSELMAYGSVEPTQTMNTGQPIMDEYLDEAEWLAVLQFAGINHNQEE